MFPRVAQGCGEWRPCRLCGNAMTIDVAKPEPGRIESSVRDQEKKTPPSVRQWLAPAGPGRGPGGIHDDPQATSTNAKSRWDIPDGAPRHKVRFLPPIGAHLERRARV